MTKKIISLVFGAIFALFGAYNEALANTSALDEKSAVKSDENLQKYNETLLFAAYDSLLQVNVRGAKVYIAGFDTPAFVEYMNAVGAMQSPKPKDTAAFRAYWLNIFNSCVLANLVENKGLLMTINKKGFYSEDTFLIAGKYHTLDGIRDSVLRTHSPKFPYLHFGLWYGCESSPKLHNRAFVAASCTGELFKLAKIFLKGNTGALLDIGANVLNLPTLFDEYSVDFGWSKKSIFNFVAPMLRDTEGAYLAVHHEEVELGYREWSWKVAETRTPPKVKEVRLLQEADDKPKSTSSPSPEKSKKKSKW